MNNKERRPTGPIRLRWYVWGLAAAWTAAVGATLTWELLDEWNQALDLARAEARGAFKRDEGFLRWYTAQGGIYVPVGPTAQPSPYLAGVPQRDIATPAGTRMTLMNPSDLIAQIQRLSAEDSDFEAHLHGLHPIRPENAPDPWEQEALEAFDRGQAEVSSLQTVQGRSVMRLMRPLLLEKGCLKCHTEPGLTVGQVYGGISLSVPMASVWPVARSEMIRRLVGYGGVGLLGLFGIALGMRNLQRQIEGRRQAERALREQEAQMIAAQRIQEHLLPDAAPALAGYDIAGASSPAEFTSGDQFDYIPMLDGGTGFAIGDVSGHGYGPALLMASTHTLLRILAQTDRSLSEIVASANRHLLGITQEESFVTLFLGRLDPSSGSFAYVSAGHPAGLVLDRDGAVKARLESTAPALAVMPDAAFPSGPPLLLEPGDTVLLLTDGILEAASPEGLRFGQQRTLDMVVAHRDKSAAEIIRSLFEAVGEFSGRDRPSDDMTAIVIKVASSPPVPEEAAGRASFKFS